ncbi:GntR family transcriptional regulator [Rhodococcus sp. 06-412-2C]|uniref:GntR family transcriptional regulator n=1 Tax=unclassified Rhodococcus (in: high G+C Gram-positive bacteria) TaxID=192944 RepID=UPI000B9BD223|nr:MULTISPECIES: GntR family transcriptional regulator [unclassified Rhodococcus (in: high G+C Gram-positive bacteria)]OZC87155.1 GntR family transcriptional regulator [Rhodococcus sp. 06-412-2C]OZD00595.1 GntR family transcriptional regulator [Rhodococcus sp. 06-412-2B]
MSSSYSEDRRPRRRLRLSDEAAAHIRERILAGELRAGEFIRSEAVADELDISATPAREGLLLLQSEGFLKVMPRKGFVVAPLDPRDIDDVFTAQSLLGGELAARASTRVDGSVAAALGDIQDRLEEAARVKNYDEVERLNHAFHRTVYALADSPKLQWLIGSTLGYAPRTFFAAIPGWPEASARDHRRIVELLAAGNSDGVRTAMAAHILDAGRLLTAHVSNMHEPRES